MGPEFVLEFREIMAAIETDEGVKVVVFDSAVEGFFLNHSDFIAKLEDLTGIPPGPTGLEAWPDILVRLPRAPVVSIALIRGRATGNGSEVRIVTRIATLIIFAKHVLNREAASGTIPVRSGGDLTLRAMVKCGVPPGERR